MVTFTLQAGAGGMNLTQAAHALLWEGSGHLDCIDVAMLPSTQNMAEQFGVCRGRHTPGLCHCCSQTPLRWREVSALPGLVSHQMVTSSWSERGKCKTCCTLLFPAREAAQMIQLQHEAGGI